MKNVVFLIEQPLDQRNYDRFGIQTWAARGWHVEVWDLTPLAYPRIWQSFFKSERKLSEFEGYFPIRTHGELRVRCSLLREIGCFVDLTGDTYHSLRAKMRLARAGALRLVCDTGSIPDPRHDKHSGLASKIRKALLSSPLELCKLVWHAFLSRVAILFARPALTVVSGEKSLRASRNAGRTRGIVRAHNLDYDIYLKLKQRKRDRPEGYGVFLDQNICFAPDYEYANVPPYATAGQYYPAICDGLKRISNALQTPIRIAAHPRLPDQKTYVEYFDGIPVEFGKTGELIADCSFVVCHYSTAIQLAVLFAKPVIIVTTTELSMSSAGEYISAFAAALGKSAVSLNDDLDRKDWEKEVCLDLQKYGEYKMEYIKTQDSPESPHWDIVINYLEASSLQARVDSPHEDLEDSLARNPGSVRLQARKLR